MVSAPCCPLRACLLCLKGGGWGVRTQNSNGRKTDGKEVSQKKGLAQKSTQATADRLPCCACRPGAQKERQIGQGAQGRGRSTSEQARERESNVGEAQPHPFPEPRDLILLQVLIVEHLRDDGQEQVDDEEGRKEDQQDKVDGAVREATRKKARDKERNKKKAR